MENKKRTKPLPGKHSATLVLFLSGFFLFPLAVAAQQSMIRNYLNNTAVTYGGYSAEKADLPTVVGGVILGLLSLLGVIFLIFIVYAGFKWMLAHGEEQKITEARNLIIQSIIGLIIVLTAYAISYFVVNTLKQAV